MIRKLLIVFLLVSSLSAKDIITPNEVYSQVMHIIDEMHFMLKYFNVKHDHDGINKRTYVSSKLKPRNAWQKTYEIMIKINILREEYKLPIIEPVNMSPVLHLNPDLVYEQTQRILTELHIFETRLGITLPKSKDVIYKGKTPIDVFNALSHVSASLDELNKGGVTPSYVFGENMRLLDDISLILQNLKIQDKTIPASKNIHATPSNTFNTGMKMLDKIKQLQISAGIDFVDFSQFKKDVSTPSEVFGITQMILAELQTIKAYVGVTDITRAAHGYKIKTPVEVDQLMSWNLRKLNLIHSLNRR